MRGVPFPILAPFGGVDYSKPPHLLNPDQLSDGSNMFGDIDGRYKCRKGYSALAATGPGAAVVGGINYQNSDNSFTSVVSTTTDWKFFNGVGWTTITDPANPQSGSANDQARFTAFSQGGNWYAVGVNNSNLVRYWKAGDAKYTTPTGATSGRDIITLANRVVLLNTVEAGTRYSRRARWSSFEDVTTWGALNFNDMLDSNDAIIGAGKIGSGAAAVYGSKSIWVLQANPGGTDASAFTAEELFSATGYSGPLSPACILVAEGAHYYLASNFHVYRFDGIQPTDISDPICPQILKLINAQTGTRCHAIYLPEKRGLVFFLPTITGGNDCVAAVYFDLKRGVWEPPWNFAEGISSSWNGTNTTGQTWANDPFSWNNTPYTWDSIPNVNQLASFIGTVAGQVHGFFQSTTDNGAVISYSAFGPLFTPDISQVISIDRAEFYLDQTIAQEFLTFQFDGYGQPGQSPTGIVSFGADISATSWVDQMILPGALNPNNITANFIRLGVFSNANAGGFSFAGGVLWLFLNDKGDYSVNTISS